ncbi:unnamed protein product [Allacma fusca]|uniref:Uncharacterized protein n=1 Tax=Allacma fusca TaxID=39272 RepID=A0A8J2JY12_9HEXA|nr:unnamed protein product [Allacma fusca]
MPATSAQTVRQISFQTDLFRVVHPCWNPLDTLKELFWRTKRVKNNFKYMRKKALIKQHCLRSTTLCQP